MSDDGGAPPAADHNPQFWAELCGTTAARRLGVTDRSAQSLRRFDQWYFDFYPYLERHVPFADARGRDVLEVGLGYGSVAQRLAERGARYTGLDISPGPVEMVNYRLALHGLEGRAVRGSVLECPFDDASFDHVVAIGCFHHTGDLARAIDEAWRVLRPGGCAWIMVYNAYSYRRWLRWPGATARYWRWDRLGIGDAGASTEAQRLAYDADSSGRAAPETVFVSRAHLRRLCRRFERVDATLENFGGWVMQKLIPRPALLATVGRACGLDVYLRAVK